jgi:serine/threonine protein kinase
MAGTEFVVGDEPARVGNWGLTSRLGVGGMGAVYLGSDGTRLAAIKIIAPGIAHDPSFRRRFRREIEICQRVTGPQVAELLDAGPDDPQPWLAVRYIPGPTLREAIANHGPLLGDTLKGFAIAVAEALRQIHSSGVVHRDLKPSNVILTPKTPVIIDFGIAGLSEGTSLTATGTVLGSAGWMAPEQILGHPSGTPADVFSWGAIVTFAATGKPPYGEGRPEALAYRIVHQEPQLEGVPEFLRPLVQRALGRTPADRPTIDELLAILSGTTDSTRIAADIASAWTGVDATAISQAPTTPAEPTLPPTRRPTALGLLTLAVIVALVAGIAVYVRNVASSPATGERSAAATSTSAAHASASAGLATTTAPPSTRASSSPPTTTSTPRLNLVARSLGGGTKILVPAGWSEHDNNSGGSGSTVDFTDPHSPAALHLVFNGCTGCIDEGNNLSPGNYNGVPYPEAMLPQGRTLSQTKLDAARMAYSAVSPVNGYKADGIIIIVSSGGSAEWGVSAEIDLPAQDHDIATKILNSLSP